MSDELTRVTAALEALGDDATPEEVLAATHGYTKRDIAAAMFSLTDGGGGGGSQPFDSVTIENTGGGIVLAAATDANGDSEAGLEMDADGLVSLDLTAGLGVDGRAQINLSDDDFDGNVFLSTAGNSTIAPRSTALEGDEALKVGLFATSFNVLRDGYPVIRVHAAPADGSLAAGECALWFDQSNGAAKLMIKGKSANGTVVTGEVALT